MRSLAPKPAITTALLIAALLLPGCASAWETHFAPSAGASLAPDPDGYVEIRRVPWERLDEALHKLEEDVANSDTHPSEWPQDRLASRDAKVLRALQISEPVDRARILGRSVFRSTRPISPDDGSLEQFAQKIGADYAVWTSRYEGKTLVTDRETVTTQGYVWDGYRDRRYGGNYSFNETTYIPVVVEADEYAWIAYFVDIIR
ncbi:MAG: hypothetical protein CMJ31_04155 [Phycisphaerae bacterium]|nr:hypothetical protein [Phycisphaerae bacterium]